MAARFAQVLEQQALEQQVQAMGLPKQRMDLPSLLVQLRKFEREQTPVLGLQQAVHRQPVHRCLVEAQERRSPLVAKQLR